MTTSHQQTTFLQSASEEVVGPEGTVLLVMNCYDIVWLIIIQRNIVYRNTVCSDYSRWTV